MVALIYSINALCRFIPVSEFLLEAAVMGIGVLHVPQIKIIIGLGWIFRRIVRTGTGGQALADRFKS